MGVHRIATAEGRRAWQASTVRKALASQPAGRSGEGNSEGVSYGLPSRCAVASAHGRVHVPVGWYAVGDQNGERGALLGFGE